MNKDDLVNKIQNITSQIKAEEIVELIINSIKETVASGKDFRLAGLGIFRKKAMKAREARNPRTGAVVRIPTRGKIKFTPSLSFKELVR